MSKLIKIIVFCVILFPLFVQSQTVTWQKWYDYNHLEEAAWDGLQTFDGGYVILSTSFSSPDSTALLKLDYLGNVVWRKIYGDSIAQPLPNSIQQTTDSGFIVAGGVGSVRGFLSRLDKTGNLLWKKYYRKNTFATRFFDCQITKDGGIIACGDLYPPFKGYVIKTDSAGNLEWDSIYSNVSKKIIQSMDGSYYFCNPLSLTKLSSYGSLIWSTDFSHNAGNDLVENSEGYIFTCGGSNSIDVIKHDTSGKSIWFKSYYKEAVGLSLCIGKDQNILLLGAIDTAIQVDIATVKINSDGDQIFKKRIETVPGSWFKFPSSIRPTTDSGFIISGYTDYPGFFFYDNVLVVKTDSTCYASQIVGINNNNSHTPVNFYLNQNYPNPFNPSTTIAYSIPASGIVKIKIYDITGKEIVQVVNEVQETGRYEVQFDGSNFASGVYFYKIESGSFIETKRMVLLK